MLCPNLFKSLALGLIILLVFFTGKSIVYAEMKWDIGATVNEGFDDNITYRQKNKESDWITRLGLGVGATSSNRSDIWSIKGGLIENLYARHTSFNNLSEVVDGKYQRELSPYSKLTLSESFRHAEEPRSFTDSFGRESGRYSTNDNVFGINLDRQMSKRWLWEAHYQQSNTSYSRDDLRSSVLYAPGWQTMYTLNSRQAIITDYTFFRRTFDGGSEATVNQILGGYRHYLTQQWFIDLKPGVSLIKAFDGQRLTRPRYEAVMTDDVDENTRWDLRYAMEYAANGYSQDLFNNWRVSSDFIKQINPRWRGNGSIFYGEGEYNTSGIQDSSYGLNLGLDWLMNKKMTMSFNYIFDSIDSSRDTRSYRKNAINAGVKVLF